MSKNATDSQTVKIFFDRYYHDRGKMKWQGFYLSDHTAALKKADKKLKHENNLRPKQTIEEITKLLMQSYSYNQIVKVQLNTFDANHQVADDLVGEVVGYDENKFYLDNQKTFHLGEVRNVSVLV